MGRHAIDATDERPRRAAKTLIALLLTLLSGCDNAPPRPTADTAALPQPQSLPTVDLPVGRSHFSLQVAAAPNQREIGLMHVRSMPADRGMIFLFPAERLQGFWMKNTPIDLDIVYVDHLNRIVAVKPMYAYDETTVGSDEPADVAIELNQGAAALANVAVGDVLPIPSELRTKAR